MRCWGKSLLIVSLSLPFLTLAIEKNGKANRFQRLQVRMSTRSSTAAAHLKSNSDHVINLTNKCMDQEARSTPLHLVRGGTTSALKSRRPVSPRGAGHTARTLSYFGLWYALNVWYNIVNKRVLNALALPASVAVAQLGIGSIWVLIQWMVGVREPPGKLAMDGVHRIVPVSLFHGGGQLATVLSLGAGAVSFTHVVKAMEPFFSALVAAVYFGEVFRTPVYLSLLPVVAGVSIACLKGGFNTHEDTCNV